ncbi:lauroyl/myristoyl acyltransferase [Dongia mobilis]|uniref:Lauroyl/myristoyl acyltransferase n=1 Tax=Dongia mobilis TaxID=578943 RepID=A0A4R6X1Y1_9PROT|nr:lysophospholipid acyltransferase family protein [Dongia mobilis]TDQ84468.1 lauroyl/myristoyl acyltransferase [Dongia mobilis]
MPNDQPTPASPDQVASTPAASGDAAGRVVHRGRKVFARESWNGSDVVTVLGLAALLLPAWLLPERCWHPFWRTLARLPLVTNGRAARKTGAVIGKALGRKGCAGIARDLKANVYEMRMQDLRSFRPAILGGGWRPAMSLEGEEHLKAALAGGKGAVLWLAPFVFNSGPTKIVLHERGYRVSHLSSPHHGYSETKFGVAWLNRVRCRWEDRYITERVVYDREAPASAMRRLMRAVKGGDIATIVAASTEGSELIKAPVFGGFLPVAVGAPRLAGLTGAPLLPVFTMRDPALGFRIVIEAPIEIAPGLSGDQRVVAAAAEFLRRSEPWVRRYPEQWRAWSKWRG